MTNSLIDCALAGDAQRTYEFIGGPCLEYATVTGIVEVVRGLQIDSGDMARLITADTHRAAAFLFAASADLVRRRTRKSEALTRAHVHGVHVHGVHVVQTRSRSSTSALSSESTVLVRLGAWLVQNDGRRAWRARPLATPNRARYASIKKTRRTLHQTRRNRLHMKSSEHAQCNRAKSAIYALRSRADPPKAAELRGFMIRCEGGRAGARHTKTLSKPATKTL